MDTLLSLPYHSMVNHFPVALLLLSLALDLAGAWKDSPEYRRAGLWTLAFGVAGGILALATGFWAARDLQARAARVAAALARGESGVFPPPEVMERIMADLNLHRLLAIAALAVFAALLVWRLTRGGEVEGRSFWPYFLVSLLAYGILAWTTILGGGISHQPLELPASQAKTTVLLS